MFISNNNQIKDRGPKITVCTNTKDDEAKDTVGLGGFDTLLLAGRRKGHRTDPPGLDLLHGELLERQGLLRLLDRPAVVGAGLLQQRRHLGLEVRLGGEGGRQGGRGHRGPRELRPGVVKLDGRGLAVGLHYRLPLGDVLLGVLVGRLTTTFPTIPQPGKSGPIQIALGRMQTIVPYKDMK
eukprot:scaffold113823_cov20-Prasinocladus_malaysianus.AAC.1